jgi:hypothetical protein
MWCPTRADVKEAAARLHKAVQDNRVALRIPDGTTERTDKSRIPSAAAAAKRFLVAYSAVTYPYMPGSSGLAWNGRALTALKAQFKKFSFPPHELKILLDSVGEVEGWTVSKQAWLVPLNEKDKGGPGSLVLGVKRILWADTIGINPSVRVVRKFDKVCEFASTPQTSANFRDPGIS